MKIVNETLGFYAIKWIFILASFMTSLLMWWRIPFILKDTISDQKGCIMDSNTEIDFKEERNTFDFFRDIVTYAHRGCSDFSGKGWDVTGNGDVRCEDVFY